MVFITINGQKERIDNFCGNKLPPQLMSNGVSMSVEFKSFHSPDNINVRGFEATYRFLTSKCSSMLLLGSVGSARGTSECLFECVNICECT